MQCHFINLDSANARRAAIEANFAACSRPGWQLHRFSACTEEEAQRRGLPGTASWKEKACFHSHRSVIEAHSGDGSPFMVVEDDAQFGMLSLDAIDGILANDPGSNWDILFTDIAVEGLQTMLLLGLNRGKLLEERQIVPLDLARIPFSGATAYIVRDASRPKVLAVLEAGIPLDLAYDVLLAHAIAHGKLKAAVLFPFVTTVSEHAGNSQIQPGHKVTSDLARITFRRMMWMESTPQHYLADLRLIESRTQGTLHATIASLAGATYLVD